MYNIWNDDGYGYQNDTMPFERLSEIKGVDHQQIRLALAKIENFANDEFYTNANSNSPNFVLDFIINHVNFLMKDPTSGQILPKLVNVLKTIITRIRNLHQLPEYFIANKDRVLITLNNLMDSRQENDAKVEGGRAINALLEMKSLHIYELKSLYELAVKSFAVFRKANAILELSRLTTILLKLRLTNRKPLVEWVETTCVAYLKMVNEDTAPQEIIELLNCLLAYYETRDQASALEKVVTNNLKGLLSHLCAFMNHTLLRNTTEQLLIYLVYDLYCTSICPFDEIDILAEIKKLPDNYEEWPSTATMFFVFAYLQLLHSQCLWKPNVILEAANSYLSLHVLVPPVALKALAWLYPMLSIEDSTNDYNIKKRLFTTLTTHKSLGSLLTYDTMQMGWLLQQADATLKTRLLTVWLGAQKDDEILEVLNATRKGHLLFQIFLMCPDSSIGLRVLGLIVRLETYPDLAMAIEATAPLFCNRPDIYSMFLQMKPAVSSNPTEILSSVKIVGACMPLLEEDTAIQAACSYSMSLLDALAPEDHPEAVLLFCNFSATLKCLAARCGSLDDVTAIAALTLLKRLTTIQISKGILLDVHVSVNFINILRGNAERVKRGLQLLALLVVLSNNRKKLILECPSNFYWKLCHLLCSLLEKNQELCQIFDILKLLIQNEPHLSFSLAIPYSLRIICVSNLDKGCRKPFLAFLKTWLTQVIDILYADVPTDLLKSFLQQFPQNMPHRAKVLCLLDNYERRRW